MPRLRDPKNGWLNFAALFYSLVSSALGLAWMLRYYKTSLVRAVLGILLSVHGRILASYLVHEAAHANIFLEPTYNRWFGTVCLWAAAASNPRSTAFCNSARRVSCRMKSTPMPKARSMNEKIMAVKAVIPPRISCRKADRVGRETRLFGTNMRHTKIHLLQLLN